MKLLYLTDTHFRGTTPRSRLDDFPETLRAKLREVVALAREQGVAAVLHGGDLFDRPDVAPAVALEYLRILMEAPCPIYGIAGNHDIYGFNPQTLPRTMLGLFDGFGLFRLIRPGQTVWIEAEGLRVQVTGQEFHADLDRREPVLDYCVAAPGTAGAVHFRSPGADFALHLTHGMLLERPFLEEIAHTLVAQVVDQTLADVTFAGHYHPGFGSVISRGGRLFINPGALVRLGYQAADFQRPVQVALVELERGTTPTCRMLPLRSAPDAAAVLDRSREEAQLARERALADFVMAIGEVEQFEALEVQTIMERIADHNGLPGRVRAEALRRLGEAQQGLGAEEEPA